MPTAEPDRVFAVVPFGGFRDMVLREFRSALRGRTNPDTGSAFTEAEIAYALAKGSRWWIGAQAIEQVAQIQQSRAVWLADQALPGTASSEWLERYHAPAWLEEPALLDATGSQGFVLAIAPNGSSFAGSTTPEDPAAVQLRDPSTGRRFQVLSTTVIASGGQREIEVFGLDGGEDTNISIGDVLEWVNAPAGTEPTAEATTNFSGGTDRETDQDRVRRIEDAIRWRQGAGNWAQIRSWARDASNAVEDAFIYPCALGAGTTVVSLVQKRSTATGPLARIPTTSVRDLVRDEAPGLPGSHAGDLPADGLDGLVHAAPPASARRSRRAASIAARTSYAPGSRSRRTVAIAASSCATVGGRARAIS